MSLADFSWIVCFLVVNNSLYLLDNSSLSDVSCRYFLPVCAYFFIILTVFLAEQRFNLVKFSLSIFLLLIMPW
jgi:hypothetical protein